MINAGFAMADITPGMGARLGRLIATPHVTENVLSPLYARMGIFDDGKRRVAIVGIDQSFFDKNRGAEMRSAISSAGGLDEEDILIAASHTHNGPYLTPWLADDDIDFSIIDSLCKTLGDITRQAVRNMRPARLKVGSIDASDLTVNRRSVYRGEDGREHVGTHGPTDVENFLGTEGPNDGLLQILLAEDEDSRCLGGIVNFACHPTCTFNCAAFSSDYIGPLTEALHARYGSAFVFLNGVIGNISPVPSKVSGEEFAKKMGQTLAEKAQQAVADGAYVEGEPIGVEREILTIAQRRPSKKQLIAAEDFLARIRKGEDLSDQCQSFVRQIYGHDYIMYGTKINSLEIMAGMTIGQWEYQRRVKAREVTEEIEIQAIAVGEVAFVAYPCEIFSEFGIEMRNQSPFKHTFVAELANGFAGYIPTKESFERGGYETSFGYHSRLVPQAGEIMQRSALNLLAKLNA